MPKLKFEEEPLASEAPELLEAPAVLDAPEAPEPTAESAPEPQELDVPQADDPALHVFDDVPDFVPPAGHVPVIWVGPAGLFKAGFEGVEYVMEKGLLAYIPEALYEKLMRVFAYQSQLLKQE